MHFAQARWVDYAVAIGISPATPTMQWFVLISRLLEFGPPSSISPLIDFDALASGKSAVAVPSKTVLLNRLLAKSFTIAYDTVLCSSRRSCYRRSSNYCRGALKSRLLGALWHMPRKRFSLHAVTKQTVSDPSCGSIGFGNMRKVVWFPPKCKISISRCATLMAPFYAFWSMRPGQS